MIREIIIFFLPLLIWYIHGKYGIHGSLPSAIIIGFMVSFLMLISKCQTKTKSPNYGTAAKLSIPVAVTFLMMVLVLFIGDSMSNPSTKQVLLSPVVAVIAGFISSLFIYSPIPESSICA